MFDQTLRSLNVFGITAIFQTIKIAVKLNRKFQFPVSNTKTEMFASKEGILKFEVVFNTALFLHACNACFYL